MVLIRTTLALFLAACVPPAVDAQSLDPKAPAPLQPGENRATVDSAVGSQFWSFAYGKGKASLLIHFTAMGVLGAPGTASIQVVLHAGDGRYFGSRQLRSSGGKPADLDWPATFTDTGTVIVEIQPPQNSLIRTGGDYTIAVQGAAVDFRGVRARGPEQIAGTYAVKGCPPDFDCSGSLSIRFKPDGTVQTSDGHRGTWEVFDEDALIYSVVIGADHWSLKLLPGRGLADVSNPEVLTFQSIK